MDPRREIKFRKPLLAFALACALALGACRKTPKPDEPVDPDQPLPERAGKMVVALAKVPSVRIEMPDGGFHDFGSDFQAALTTHLTESGRYILIDAEEFKVRAASQSRQRSRVQQLPNDYFWNGSVTPAATVSIDVEKMAFETGARGEKMFYGFDQNFRTPYNDGTGRLSNEFPLRSVKFDPNWFDRVFDRKGGGVTHSQVGLDLGDGFDLDVLFAYFKVKHANYQGSIGLKVNVDAPVAGVNEYRLVDVVGKGFFFDVVAGYMEYSAGIQVARKDAMDRALKRAIRGTFRAIERSVIALPLTARIDGIVPPSQSVSGQTDILIGTGAFSNVKPGTLYEVIDMPGMVIQVVKSVASGSVGQLVQGSQNELQPGMLLREAGWTKRPKLFRAAGEISTLAATESIDLPRQNFPKQDLSRWVNDISRWEAIAKSIAGAVLLPYRIWRYRNYDQEYKEGRIEALVDESPDGLDRASDASASEPGRTGVDVTGTDEWARKMRGEWWARRIGLSESGEMPDLGLRSPVVAVIDTGVDYNHAAIHDQAWKNLVPKFGDDYGWDFISNDPRPYDDGYHGTAVAGHVLAVAPKARIMPLKVFNAFGITSSAAVHGAIRYAVDHGARIIVMGWASRLPTQTIDGAIEYAREKGVLIVTAAGDRGESLRVVPTYPASYARDTENVLAVANVDVADKLVRVRGKASNYDPSTVAIAAPGYNLTVAEPRNNLNRETGTGMSAAIVAGAVARNVAFRLEAGRAGTPAEWIAELLDQAERVPGLEPYVAQGHRVRIVR